MMIEALKEYRASRFKQLHLGSELLRMKKLSKLELKIKKALAKKPNVRLIKLGNVDPAFPDLLIGNTPVYLGKKDNGKKE